MKTTLQKFVSATIAVAIAVFTLLYFAPAAWATTVTECKTMIATLSLETQSTTFFGPNAAKDEAGLLGKLSDASLKLDQGKFLDAIQKLTDFRSKVVSLAAQGKINTDPSKGTTAQDLINGADAAIQCIHDVCGC